MEFSDLHTLLMVSQEESFSRAAVLLHRTQPAISLAIRRLEQRIGTPLFTRESKRPELTEAGRVLVAYAREVATLQNEARNALADLRGRQKGRVTIGVGETLVNMLLPFVARFRDCHPDVRVDARPLRSDETLRRLGRGELDLGVIDYKPSTDNLKAAIIGRDPWVVVMPSRHPLASRTSLSSEDLAGQPFVELSWHADEHAQQSVARRAKSPLATVALTLSSLDGVKESVLRGLGLAILPASAIAGEVAAGTLVAAELRDRHADRSVWLVRSTSHAADRAATAFFELTSATVALPPRPAPLPPRGNGGLRPRGRWRSGTSARHAPAQF